MIDAPKGWNWVQYNAIGPHGRLFRLERVVDGRKRWADRWAALGHQMATAEIDVVNVVLVEEQTAEIARLRAALLAQRDCDDEFETETRIAGPCWCPAWVNTKKVGHAPQCAQARKALGVDP